MGKWKELAGIHTCHADCQKPACVATRQAASGKPQAMKPTQEQVIAWAREAGIEIHPLSWYCTQMQRFAALAYEAGRKDENEACAVMTNILQKSGVSEDHLADAIRARREQ